MANGINVEIALLDSTDETTSVSPTIVSRRSGAATHIYVFFINASAELTYRKSTNGGTTWGSQVTIDSGESWATVAVWYDRWTPGDITGNLIHIAASSTTNDKIVYFSLDTSTDLAGTNNDVDIVSWTDFTPLPDGCISICKAANDDLYAGAMGGSGPVGIQVAQSTDDGAGWTDISSPAGGTDIQAEYAAALDVMQLLPLSTDNDIILLAIDGSASNLESVVFDPIAGEWGTVTTINAGTAVVGNINQVYSGTVDKSTGNIHIVYKDGDSNDGAPLFHNIFTDSGRTWGGTPVAIFTSVNNNTLQTMNGLGISRDETNGTLMIGFSGGTVAGAQQIHFMMSSDDGATWSDVHTWTDALGDDFRGVHFPAVINDIAEGWNPISYNDDLNDIRAVLNGISYETFSGTVFDADGTTPVSGADVAVFRSTIKDGAAIGSISNSFQGQKTSDGSGNYKVTVFPNLTDDSETATYYATGYKQGGTDVDDEMDVSREETSD